jgi:hypothetical protein
LASLNFSDNFFDKFSLFARSIGDAGLSAFVGVTICGSLTDFVDLIDFFNLSFDCQILGDRDVF